MRGLSMTTSQSRVAGTLVLLAMLVAFSGCLTAYYRDVSAEPPHSDRVGEILEATEILDLYKIRIETAFGEPKRFYRLFPRPGFGGREVVNRARFDIGKRVRILSVRKCLNCVDWTKGRYDYVVEIVGTRKYGKAPIYLNFRHLDSFQSSSSDL